jgi:hypothetical protein
MSFSYPPNNGTNYPYESRDGKRAFQTIAEMEAYNLGVECRESGNVNFANFVFSCDSPDWRIKKAFEQGVAPIVDYGEEENWMY